MAAQCICTRPPGNGSQTVRTPANIVFAIFPESDGEAIGYIDHRRTRFSLVGR
jgi:hypothetical protein